MELLELYLKYLDEKEWDDDPKNDDAFDQKLFSKVIGGPESSIEPFNDVRHDLDTDYFDIYMRNMLGDYKGRTDSFNVSADRMPFNKYSDAQQILSKIRADYAKIRSRYDDTDDARYKAKPKAKRNPDDDFELRDDNANIVTDGDDDGIGVIGGDGGGGGE